MNTGNPRGNGPSTDTPARLDKSSAATSSVAPTTAIRMPGICGRRLRIRISASVPAPIPSVTPFV